MRALSLILVAMIFGVYAIGVYRTWFTISRPAPAAGSSVVSISVAADTAKIRQDFETIRDEAAGLTGQVKEGITPDDRPTENASSTAQ